MKLAEALMKGTQERESYTTQSTFSVADYIKQSVKYEIQNVGDYYWLNRTIYWDLKDVAQFPSLAPPHPLMWMEYPLPPKIITENGEFITQSAKSLHAGCLLIATERQSLNEFPFADCPYHVRWFLQGFFFLIEERKMIAPKSLYNYPYSFQFPVNGDGTIGSYKNKEHPFEIAIPTAHRESEREMSQLIAQHSKPFCLTLSFLNCNNVIVLDHAPPKKPPKPKKGGRKTFKPPIKTPHKTLEIWPLRDVARYKKGNKGTKKSVGRVPIVRGHFRTYTESGKLFGKYEGRFWIPQHLRGGQSEEQRERRIRL